MASLPDNIRDLSDVEKFELLDALWEDLESHASPLTIEQADELDHRVQAYHQDPAAVVPWEQVKAGRPKP